MLLKDGGTLGLNLYEDIADARRVLVFDAIDFGLPPGTLRVLRDDEVPAWGRTKLSPHQIGFNDVLALAQLNGRAPDTIVAIGVQPVELDDFGGSLREPVREPPSRGRGARRAAAGGVGLSRHAARARRRLRAAERRPCCRSTSTSPAAPARTQACRDGDERVLVRGRAKDSRMKRPPRSRCSLRPKWVGQS